MVKDAPDFPGCPSFFGGIKIRARSQVKCNGTLGSVGVQGKFPAVSFQAIIVSKNEPLDRKKLS